MLHKWLCRLFSGYFCWLCSTTLILILNIWILIVAEKQRKRILAETVVPSTTSNGHWPANRMSAIHGFFHAVKAVKTFSVVVALLAFCVFTPIVVWRVVLQYSCLRYTQMRYLVFNYEFYAINSIVNAFIYGMRHIKYRKAYKHILF